MGSSTVHVGANPPLGPLKQGMVWIKPATSDGPSTAVVCTSMGWKSCPVPTNPGKPQFPDTVANTKGLGPTPFCENPKCDHSKTMVPADAGESWKAKKMPAELGVAACPEGIANLTVFTIGRFEVVRDYGGMSIRSYFCEICYEAIKTVEGM